MVRSRWYSFITLLHNVEFPNVGRVWTCATVQLVRWRHLRFLSQSLGKIVTVGLIHIMGMVDMYVRCSTYGLSGGATSCITTMATSKSFSSVASCIWNARPNHLSSIPTLLAFRRALKHHLFLLAYPDSSAKSGTAWKYHATHLKAFHLSTYN